MNIDELEALARKATPGPWWIESHLNTPFIPDENKTAISAAGWGAFTSVVTKMEDESEPSTEGVGNLNYIAAANPTTVLELIAQLKQFKKERDTLQVRVGEMAAEVERLSSTFGHDTIVNHYLPLMRKIHTVINDVEKVNNHGVVTKLIPEIESFFAQIGERLKHPNNTDE